MIVTCKKCLRRYRINKEKFLYTQKSHVKCPACRELIQLNRDNEQKPDSKKDIFAEYKGDGVYGNELKQELVNNLKKLYPMPHVILKARKLINDPESDFTGISNLLKSDPALAGRVLKVANSAYYGMSGQISSIRQASVLLGIRLLSQIVTMVSNSKLLGKELKGYGLNSGDLWRHSIFVAAGADLISGILKVETDHDLFFAGLIHDSGKILLDNYLAGRIGTSPLSEGNTNSGLKTERKLLGFDHAEAGYELCINWNLPEQVANAVRYHHEPEKSDGNVMAYILYVVNCLSYKNLNQPDEVYDDGLRGALSWLGLSNDDLVQLNKEIIYAVESLEEDSL